MKKILLILCLILHACIIRINAQDKVTFKASAPDAVAVGDQFRLSFVVSSTDIKDRADHSKAVCKSSTEIRLQQEVSLSLIFF